MLNVHIFYYRVNFAQAGTKQTCDFQIPFNYQSFERDKKLYNKIFKLYQKERNYVLIVTGATGFTFFINIIKRSQGSYGIAPPVADHISLPLSV